VPAVLLGPAGLALAVLLGVALLVAFVPAHPEASVPFCVIALSLIASPTVVATRRIARSML
jgi:hypothetical protein